jgi:hypothetical protein
MNVSQKELPYGFFTLVSDTQAYAGLLYPHLSQLLSLVFFNNNQIINWKIGTCHSATWSSIVMLYTDFSASRQTRLLVFPKVAPQHHL